MGKRVSFSLIRGFCPRWALLFQTQWSWRPSTLHPKASWESKFSVLMETVVGKTISPQEIWTTAVSMTAGSTQSAVEYNVLWQKALEQLLNGLLVILLSPTRCGLRGGYVELVNLDPAVTKYIYNLFSKDSCAPVLGQIALDLMTNPPQPGDPSYPCYNMVGLCNSNESSYFAGCLIACIS